MKPKAPPHVSPDDPPYGQWQVLSVFYRRGWVATCRCSCGTIRDIPQHNLIHGYSSRCRKCADRSVAAHMTKHGMALRDEPRLYKCWKSMKWRCQPVNHRARAGYHARGIAVCDEWLKDFSTFMAWSLANGYADHLTLDRIDNNQGYSPSNCRWATYLQQGRNSRRNRLLTAWGETKTLVEWSEDPRCVHNYKTLSMRILRGMPVEAALTTPLRQGSSKTAPSAEPPP